MSDSGAASKLELLLQIGSCQRRAMNLLLRADAAKRAGNLDQAIRIQEELIEVNRRHLELAQLHNRHYEPPFETGPIAQPLINALTTQADYLQSMGQPDQARTHRDEALRLAKDYFGEQGDAREQRRRAASLTSEGRFNEALTALAASRDFFEQEGNLVEMARSSLDLVDILQWLGDFDRAAQELEHAKQVIEPHLRNESASASTLMAGILSGQSDVLSGAGDGSRATTAAEVYRIAVELDYYRGLVAKGQEDYATALESFGKVYDHYRGLGVASAVDFQFADVYLRQGRIEECLELVERMEPTFLRDQNLRPKYGALLKLRGEADLQRGQATSALESARKGLQDMARFVDPDLLWKLQGLEGSALEALGRDDEAVDAYRKAAQIISHLRIAPLGFRLDSTFLRDKHSLYLNAIRLTASKDDWESCAGFIEEIKSRSLRVVLSTPREPESTEDALRKQFDELTRDIDALDYQGYSGKVDRASVENRRAGLLDARANLLERLRFSDPRWRNISAPTEWSPDDTLEALRRHGQAALSLFVDGEHVTAILLRDGAGRVGRLALESETLEKIERYVENLQASDPDPQAFDASRYFALGAKHLVDPDLLSEALNSQSLIVVPHGLLHLLPWGSLIFQGKRLFEYCPVGVLPNLSCLSLLEHDGGPPSHVALIGAPDYANLPELSPLEAAQDEIESIRGLYKEAGAIIEPVLTGAVATEAGFRELARHPESQRATLHVACHGIPEPSFPAYSGLLLTDARIDASEISRLSLRYTDVVLSACNTGWRPVEVQGVSLEGDEILGLPAAFLEAGARSVLVSIPPADDRAAARLMLGYLQNRLAGESPMGALRSSEIEMLSKNEHPEWSWSGFVLYGSA